MDKISIIIPVFNVEPYIRKCLNSVLTQTHKNIEVILINDGSTDKSGEICDEYAEKNNEIKVFHQKRQGVSNARNVGLRNLTGEFIGFTDPDDWLDPQMYETMLQKLKSGASICVCRYFKSTATVSIPIINKNKISEEIISTQNLLLYPLKREYYEGFFSTLWNKLFCADIIKGSGLFFDENISYGEDIIFYSNLVAQQKCKGVFIDKPFYHWLQRDASLSKSRVSNIKLGILQAYKEVENILNTYGFSDDSYWARAFYCHHASVIAQIAIDEGQKDLLLQMQAEIRSHFQDYKKTNLDFPEKFERIENILKENM